MSKMTVVHEQTGMEKYKKIEFVEFLEMMGRIAHFKIQSHEPLAVKIGYILDIVFELIGVQKKDYTEHQVDEESMSNEDY
jgi:hypothetical protein